MSSIKYPPAVSIVRSIMSELKLATKDYKTSEKGHKKIDESIKHMFNITKENRVTEKRFCRPEDHYKYFALTYLTYLKSTRLQQEITGKYFNKDTRSVEETARLVGLEVPKRQDSH